MCISASAVPTLAVQGRIFAAKPTNKRWKLSHLSNREPSQLPISLASASIQVAMGYSIVAVDVQSHIRKEKVP
jgi:hypothetical protein